MALKELSVTAKKDAINGSADFLKTFYKVETPGTVCWGDFGNF